MGESLDMVEAHEGSLGDSQRSARSLFRAQTRNEARSDEDGLARSTLGEVEILSPKHAGEQADLHWIAGRALLVHLHQLCIDDEGDFAQSRGH